MLTRLKLENFRTWQSADLKFGKITGLFGTNSSGKSSLIQFLLLLKQTKEATDRAIALNLNDKYARLGIFSDMIYNHNGELKLSWSFSFKTETELNLRDLATQDGPEIARGHTVEISSSVLQTEKTQSLAAEFLRYKIGGVTFKLAQKSANEKAFELSSTGGDFRFIRTQGRAWQLPGPIKSYAFPDQARTYFQNASFLADLEQAYETQLDKIYYLGPLREYPQRDYLWARSRPTDVGPKGENTIDAILAMTASNEYRNIRYKTKRRPFQEIVAYWLAELGVIYDFRVDEIAEGSNRWQAKVRIRKGGAEVLLTDVGFGVSQVLPVVTLLQYVPEGATVILEQPEIHLHPLAQANLADAIINAATHRKVQIILESHSEHLLLRLQRRIAEGDIINNDDVKLYFCDASSGASELRPLEIDLLGSIRNWPDKFMGDAFGETASAEIARLKRLKAAE